MGRDRQPLASSLAPSPALLLLAALLGAGFAAGARLLAARLGDAQLQAAACLLAGAFAAGGVVFAWRPQWHAPPQAARVRARAAALAAIALLPASAAGLALLGSDLQVAAALACVPPLLAAGCAFAAELGVTGRRIGLVSAPWFAAAAVGLGATVLLGFGAATKVADAALALAGASAHGDARRFEARAAALGLQPKLRGQGWDTLGFSQSYDLVDGAGRTTGAGALLRDFTFTAPLLRAGHPFLEKGCGDRILHLPLTAPPARVLLAGLGGGATLLCALQVGAAHIDAVEPSAAQQQLVRAFIGAPAEDPRVHHHRAAPRAFARSARRYDLIALETARSRHGLPPGLLPLPEATLVTDDGLLELLSALEPRGMLWATAVGEPQALRLANTARAALARLGVKTPAAQLAVHRMGELYAITVARAPLGIDAVLYLHRRAEAQAKREHPAETAVGLAGAPELLFTHGAGFRNRFHALLASDGQQLARDYVFDLSAPSDDRPLFDEQTRRDRPDTWSESAPQLALPRWLAIAAVTAAIALLATARRLRPPRAALIAVAFVGLGAAQALAFAYLNHALGLRVLRPEQALALSGLALPLLALAAAPFPLAAAARPFAFVAQLLGAGLAVPLAPLLVLGRGYGALGLCALGLLVIAIAVGFAGARGRERA